MARAFLKWSVYEYGKTTASAGYTVIEATDETSALSASGAPQLNSTHPKNADLKAEQPIVRQLTPNATTWELIVRWSIPPNGGDHNATTDPSALPLEVEWIPASESEDVDRDANNSPIINSAGDAYEGETRNIRYKQLNIYKNFPEYDFVKWDAFEDTLNSNQFTVAQHNGKTLTFTPGCMRCFSIAPANRISELDTYVRMAFRFGIKYYPAGTDPSAKTVERSPWQRWRLDQGTRSLYSDSGRVKPGTLVDGRGDFISSPVRLDGKGKPVVHEYKVTKERYDAVDSSILQAPPNGPVIYTKGVGDAEVTYLIYQDFLGADFSQIGI